MSGNAARVSHIAGIHAPFPQGIHQEGAVRADAAGMIHLLPGPCRGDGLVQSLSARKALVSQ